MEILENLFALIFLIAIATIVGYIAWLIVPVLVYIWLGLDVVAFIITIVCYQTDKEFMDAPDGA